MDLAGWGFIELLRSDELGATIKIWYVWIS